MTSRKVPAAATCAPRAAARGAGHGLQCRHTAAARVVWLGSPRGGASTVGPVDGDVELKCRSPLQTLWSRQRLEVGAARAGGVSSLRPPASEQNPPSLRAPSRSADFGDCPLGTKLRPGTRNVRSQLPLPRKVEPFPTPCAPCRAPLTVLPARWSRRRAPRTVLPDSVLPMSVLPTPCSPIPCSQLRAPCSAWSLAARGAWGPSLLCPHHRVYRSYRSR